MYEEKICKKVLLTFISILIIRYIYVAITKEPYINGVCISSTLGLVIATIIVEAKYLKHSKD